MNEENLIIMNQEDLDTCFDTFQKEFISTKLMRFDDMLVYTIPAGYLDSAIADAKGVIEKSNLPLVIKVNKNYILPTTILIKPKTDA